MAVEHFTETAVPADDTLSDRELLRRFRAGHEPAFAALLQRHGTMVLRVCRRVLERPEDAEDAFQATFLVLARKAETVAWHESIATWLHAAAYRLACEARRATIRRNTRESHRTPTAEGDALSEVSSRELLAILDEELAALPEENRGPLILCCMEGMSGDEAARHLGCSESTLKRRLRHARELLQARLTRRGVALPAAAFLALLAAGTAAASLPPALAATATQAAMAVHAGQALVPGLVSERVISLSQHLLPVVSAKVKLAIGFVVVSCVAAVVTLTGGEGRGTRTAPPAVTVPAPGADAPAPAVPGIGVTIETTFRTRGEWIRQFAFDNHPDTFFASVEQAGVADHFTLVFDRPAAVTSVVAVTGTPNDSESLASGWLDVSADGVVFEPLAAFAHGTARGDAKGRTVRAVRIRPGAQPHRLLVREVQIQSDPPLAGFRRPIEFTVDTSRAPDMAEWAERAARVCERAYPMICEELSADGYRPPYRIPLSVRRDAGAIAAASGGRVIASAGYFEANPHDVGALIHATSLVVQDYRAKPAPGWLIHGIADYVRFFKFEPGTLGPPDPDIARHDGDSQETAAFLAYLVATYDSALVRRLNAALRDGLYTEDIWLELTGKPLGDLGDEWRRTIRR